VPALLGCHRDLLALLTQLGAKTCDLIQSPTRSDRAAIASAWKDFSKEWRDQWDLVNARCGFSELADSNLGVAYGRMAQVHSDLPSMRLKYQSLLVQFDKEQAAELARMRRALDQSGTALHERSGESD
jgi:hypothetical protein